MNLWPTKNPYVGSMSPASSNYYHVLSEYKHPGLTAGPSPGCLAALRLAVALGPAIDSDSEQWPQRRSLPPESSG